MPYFMFFNIPQCNHWAPEWHCDKVRQIPGDAVLAFHLALSYQSGLSSQSWVCYAASIGVWASIGVMWLRESCKRGKKEERKQKYCYIFLYLHKCFQWVPKNMDLACSNTFRGKNECWCGIYQLPYHCLYNSYFLINWQQSILLVLLQYARVSKLPSASSYLTSSQWL